MQTFDSYTLVIDRADIEDMDYSSITQVFDDYAYNHQSLIDAHSRFDISISGYDNDKRELFEIPEVLNWVNKSIDDGLPWFYFLITADRSQGIKLLSLCYCAEPVEGLHKLTHFVPKMEKLQEFVHKNFGNMNNFMQEHNLDEALNVEISDNIIAFYKKWVDEGK